MGSPARAGSPGVQAPARPAVQSHRLEVVFPAWTYTGELVCSPRPVVFPVCNQRRDSEWYFCGQFGKVRNTARCPGILYCVVGDQGPEDPPFGVSMSLRRGPFPTPIPPSGGIRFRCAHPGTTRSSDVPSGRGPVVSGTPSHACQLAIVSRVFVPLVALVFVRCCSCKDFCNKEHISTLVVLF